MEHQGVEPLITLLNGKRIILGVTGSIAAYKAADLASKLTQAGALVDVILTESAQKFVTPLTFQGLTGRPVYTDIWSASAGDSGLPTHIAHVGLAEGADLLVIAPATAHTVAKLVQGLADDMLSITALAARCPIVIAPAMDGGMFEHPATQANLNTLAFRGATLIEPDFGRFASGLEGRGRLPETMELMGRIRQVLGRKGTLVGRHVVVTAGGTHEAIDPVRSISNHSSGKQGYAIAQAALDAGAHVTLISTVTTLPEPVGAEIIRVESARDMQQAVFEALNCDALIMAAAVADFRPKEFVDQKIKKRDADLTLILTKNDDILLNVGEQRRESGRPLVVVGFAAETEDLMNNAQDKMTAKNLDLLAANDITADGAGFAVDTNIVTFFTRNNEPVPMTIASKTVVAEEIIKRVSNLLSSIR
jgi:phosphopantothenoylcysteine decarboxylase / phosphopantothenate---cysteine ligase